MDVEKFNESVIDMFADDHRPATKADLARLYVALSTTVECLSAQLTLLTTGLVGPDRRSNEKRSRDALGLLLDQIIEGLEGLKEGQRHDQQG